MARQTISSGTSWERTVGYSRAVKVGRQIFVSGTTAVDDAGEVVGVGDAYLQTKRIFDIIESALNKAGASLSDVVRTRIYLTDLTDWPEVGRAHGEVFSSIKPASTLLAVAGLIHPDLRVEIEVDAVVEPAA